MKKPTLSSDWIRTIITVATLLVGGVVGYTKLTDTVNVHEKNLEKLESAIQIQRQDINKLLTTQAISNEQYSQIAKNLDDIKREIRRGR